MVDTPYCSFCADDDIPFTDNWPRLLDFLDANPAFVATHGLYINVKPDDPFHISYMVYEGPSIEGDDGLRRLDKQMGAYQAVFYAIYRTEVLRTALHGAQRMTSLLAQELLASSLTMVRGNVHRMPETLSRAQYQAFDRDRGMASAPDIGHRARGTVPPIHGLSRYPARASRGRCPLPGDLRAGTDATNC